MPGLNTTGTPNTADINLGRGALYFAELDATTQKPLGLRHLGNCTGFTITVELDTLPHYSSRSGTRYLDREVVLTQGVKVGVTLDELNYQNIALFLAGTATAGVTNPSRTSVTDQQISAAAYKGQHYLMLNASGQQLMDCDGTITVKSGSGSVGTATTLTSGTDYTVDRKWGMIFLLSTGAHVEGNKLWFSYTTSTAEKTYDKVDILTQTKISGFLRFVSINAANSDKQQVLDLHSVNLKADGEVPLIGDEFSTLTFTGAAERNEIGFPSSPVGRFYTHADA
jgi:hypothetical protein